MLDLHLKNKKINLYFVLFEFYMKSNGFFYLLYTSRQGLFSIMTWMRQFTFHLKWAFDLIIFRPNFKWAKIDTYTTYFFLNLWITWGLQFLYSLIK